MGTFLWLAQRVSSMIILSYVLLVMISYYLKPYETNALVWYVDIHTIEMKIFTVLFLVVMITHALQGLKAIEDDYFTERTIGMFLPGFDNLAKILRFLYRGFILLVIKSSTKFSNCDLVNLIFKCFGPDASAVMNGKLTSV